MNLSGTKWGDPSQNLHELSIKIMAHNMLKSDRTVKQNVLIWDQLQYGSSAYF